MEQSFLKARRPLFYKLICGLYFIWPLAYVWMLSVFYDIAFRKLIFILLSPWFYLVAFSGIMLGYGLWEIKRWAWPSVLLFHLIVLYQSTIYGVYYGENHHKFLVFLWFVGILGLLIYQIGRVLYVPYFIPRVRWWESDLQKQVLCDVGILLKKPEEVVEKRSGKILDLSLKGCFIRTREKYLLGETVELSFQIWGQPVALKGEVVWLAQETVTHPRGIGIQFEMLNRSKRRRFQIIVRRVKHIRKKKINKS